MEWGLEFGDREDGTARLGPFPDAQALDLRVEASHPDFYHDYGDTAPDLEDDASDRVEGTEHPGDLSREIVLTRGLSVDGRLVLPEGMLPDSISVSLARRRASTARVTDFDLYCEASREDPSGPYAFRFRGLRPGSCLLRISPQLGERLLKGSMRVAAGSTGRSSESSRRNRR